MNSYQILTNEPEILQLVYDKFEDLDSTAKEYVQSRFNAYFRGSITEEEFITNCQNKSLIFKENLNSAERIKEIVLLKEQIEIEITKVNFSTEKLIQALIENYTFLDSHPQVSKWLNEETNHFREQVIKFQNHFKDILISEYKNSNEGKRILNKEGSDMILNEKEAEQAANEYAIEKYKEFLKALRGDLRTNSKKLLTSYLDEHYTVFKFLRKNFDLLKKPIADWNKKYGFKLKKGLLADTKGISNQDNVMRGIEKRTKIATEKKFYETLTKLAKLVKEKGNVDFIDDYIYTLPVGILDLIGSQAKDSSAENIYRRLLGDVKNFLKKNPIDSQDFKSNAQKFIIKENNQKDAKYFHANEVYDHFSSAIKFVDFHYKDFIDIQDKRKWPRSKKIHHFIAENENDYFMQKDSDGKKLSDLKETINFNRKYVSSFSDPTRIFFEDLNKLLSEINLLNSKQIQFLEKIEKNKTDVNFKGNIEKYNKEAELLQKSALDLEIKMLNHCSKYKQYFNNPILVEEQAKMMCENIRQSVIQSDTFTLLMKPDKDNSNPIPPVVRQESADKIKNKLSNRINTNLHKIKSKTKSTTNSMLNYLNNKINGVKNFLKRKKNQSELSRLVQKDNREKVFETHYLTLDKEDNERKKFHTALIESEKPMQVIENLLINFQSSKDLFQLKRRSVEKDFLYYEKGEFKNRVRDLKNRIPELANEKLLAEIQVNQQTIPSHLEGLSDDDLSDFKKYLLNNPIADTELIIDCIIGIQIKRGPERKVEQEPFDQLVLQHYLSLNAKREARVSFISALVESKKPIASIENLLVKNQGIDDLYRLTKSVHTLIPDNFSKKGLSNKVVELKEHIPLLAHGKLLATLQLMPNEARQSLLEARTPDELRDFEKFLNTNNHPNKNEIIACIAGALEYHQLYNNLQIHQPSKPKV